MATVAIEKSSEAAVSKHLWAKINATIAQVWNVKRLQIAA